MKNIEIKRNKLIQEAIKSGKWKRVLHLMNQEYDNLERKNRRYHLCSLNSSGFYGENELLETISDNQDSLKHILKKELDEQLKKEILKLNHEERLVLLGRVLYNMSWRKIALLTKKSDKTVRKDYFKIIEKLRNSDLKDLKD